MSGAEVMVGPAPSDLLLESDARNLRALPVSINPSRHELIVAISELERPKLKDQVSLALLADYRIRWEQRSLKHIAQGLDALYGKKSSLSQIQERIEQDFAESVIVDLVQAVFEDALIQSASDIHLSPGQHQMHLRFRVDGVLSEAGVLPLELYSSMLIRLKVLANMDIAESRLPQDGHVSLTVFGEKLDCRVSTFPVHGGENTVIRVLDRNRTWQDLDTLMLSREQRLQTHRNLNQPQGLLVVCGPTGSGKTTTLYSMIKARESESTSVMTLEDPIEFLLPRVKQSTLGSTAKMSMADAVRGLLRQDPDILLVGEVRDPETCRQCLRASLSGRLMLTTVHAADCIFALQRLCELCGDRSLVTTSVTSVISQRLLRVVCKNCAGNQADCPECAGTGYGSRQGVYEILDLNSTLRDLFRRDAAYEEILSAAKAHGYQPLRSTARDLVHQGTVSPSEFDRVMGPESC